MASQNHLVPRLSLALILVASLALASAEVGDPAPDFTLTDTNEVVHTLSEYQGTVVFLNFIGYG